MGVIEGLYRTKTLYTPLVSLWGFISIKSYNSLVNIEYCRILSYNLATIELLISLIYARCDIVWQWDPVDWLGQKISRGCQQRWYVVHSSSGFHVLSKYAKNVNKKFQSLVVFIGGDSKYCTVLPPNTAPPNIASLPIPPVFRSPKNGGIGRDDCSS